MSRRSASIATRRRSPQAAGVYALILSLAGCVSAPAEPERPLFSLPYRIDASERPVVDVSVNGRGPYEFILDTGSTTSAIFRRAMEEIDGEASWTTTAQVFGISGADARPMTAVESVTLAGAVETGLDRLVVLEEWGGPSPAPAGIIGLDVIGRYFMLVDRPAKTIRFFAPGEAPAERLLGWASAPMRAETFGKSLKPVYLLEGRMSGKTFPTLIDSGLEISIGNEPLMRMLPTAPAAPQARTDTRITGATEGSVRSFLLFFGTFSAGDIVWKDGQVYIADAELFADLGYADRPFALLGFDLLGTRSFAMDFRNLVFYAAPPAVGSAPPAAE